ncbi:hypothetical protein OUZ56_029467 [Daphnia magna]|uniref:Uncharacterized protein n=1 Tax=Daphnia magna TaxID=35525 RepID=A0ABR0B6W6_9CRUS|nr:hypothetical protein OUZ56_029467 [Daphnia magna]
MRQEISCWPFRNLFRRNSPGVSLHENLSYSGFWLNRFFKLINLVSAVQRLSGMYGGIPSFQRTGAAEPIGSFSSSDISFIMALLVSLDMPSAWNSVPNDSVSQKRLTCSTNR